MNENEQLNEVEVLLGLKDVDAIETSKIKVQRLNLELEVKPLSPKAVNEFREAMDGLEDMEQNALLISTSCVKPDFNNKDLLSKANCTFGWQFVMRKFQPGEIVHVHNFIQKISGYNDSATIEIKKY